MRAVARIAALLALACATVARAHALPARLRGASARSPVRPPSRPRGRPLALSSRAAGGWDAWGEDERAWGGEPDITSAWPPPPPGPDDGASMRWTSLEGCDVLLPPDGEPVRGLVHFVGGVLVGLLPRVAYGPLLEGLADAGYAIIATPDQQLVGFDHALAAENVAARFRRAALALEVRSGVPLAELPVFGLGHSLGAKVLLLIGADARLRRAMGTPHFANALVSYNNFSARRSIPFFAPLREFANAAMAGTGGAAARGVELLALLGSATDGMSPGTGIAEPFRRSLQQLGRLTGELGSLLSGAALPDEFVPSPAATLGAVRAGYGTRSNLVVRFLADTIDESEGLARELRVRFTAPDTGIGGRLAYRRLRGTHVTPNTPAIRASELDDLGREAALNALDELDELIDALVGFYDKETRLWVDTARDEPAEWARPQGSIALGGGPPIDPA